MTTEAPARRGTWKAHGLDPIPDNRPTFAWYFKPPIVNPFSKATTALPADCFYTADAWDPSHVDRQTRKVIGQVGNQAGVMLVCPIDRHNAMSKGVPVVAFHKPDWDERMTPPSPRWVDNWQTIVSLLAKGQEEELEVERDLLAGLADDLQYAVDATQRQSIRERQALFTARVAHLEAGTDMDELYHFFVREAERSQATLRSPEQRQMELIDDRVAKRLGELTENG